MVLEAPRGVPRAVVDVAEELRAGEDRCAAVVTVLQARPVAAAAARRPVLPALGDDVSVDVDAHATSAPRGRSASPPCPSRSGTPDPAPRGAWRPAAWRSAPGGNATMTAGRIESSFSLRARRVASGHSTPTRER